MGKASFVYSTDCLKYDFSKSHVFRPERAYQVYRFLLESPHFEDWKIELKEPLKASRSDLLLFHTLKYVDALEKEDEARLSNHGIGFGDNPFFKGIYEAVTAVAGATITAANELLNGKSTAFSFSGGLHHAHPDYAYGFCLVNDAVIAIKKMIQAGRSRPGSIVYCDIDAHFGDGVVYGLYSRPEVVTLSVHESGVYLFPGTGFANETGRDQGAGLKLNLPLPPYSAEYEFVTFIDDIFKPLLENVKPDFVVVQAGTDGYSQDPLTHLNYSPYCYLRFFEALKELQKSLGFKILLLGGGGYVPPFASLIWAASTLYLSADVDFTEAARLFIEANPGLGEIRNIDFTPAKTRGYASYEGDFLEALAACKKLVEEIGDRLRSIEIDN